MRKLTPGPGNWALPQDFHALSSSFGMPRGFSNLDEVGKAAKFRVHLKEAGKYGGLKATQRARELDRRIASSEYDVRCARLGPWLRDSFIHRLDANAEEMGDRALPPLRCTRPHPAAGLDR